MVKYAVRSGPVLIRAARDYSPFKFFGLLSVMAFVPALLLFGFTLLRPAGVLLFECIRGPKVPAVVASTGHISRPGGG